VVNHGVSNVARSFAASTLIKTERKRKTRATIMDRVAKKKLVGKEKTFVLEAAQVTARRDTNNCCQGLDPVKSH